MSSIDISLAIGCMAVRVETKSQTESYPRELTAQNTSTKSLRDCSQSDTEPTVACIFHHHLLCEGIRK